MSSIAIVGAGGFVGASLIESLVLERAIGVRAVVRACRSVAPLARFGSSIDIRLADARDATRLTEAFADCDTVLNVTTGPPREIVESTKAIHEACSRAAVRRLIHMSSAVVLGRVDETIVTDRCAPRMHHEMPYARAKAAAEQWLQDRMGKARPEIVVLRPGIVWGPRSWHTLQLAKSLLEKSAYVVGDGSGVCNAIYIENLIRCIRACYSADAGVEGYFNVADREELTWREFLGALAPHLRYDIARIPSVSAERCPLNAGNVLDWMLSLPMMNGAYHTLKRHLPDGVKSGIKSFVSAARSYDHIAPRYNDAPSVDREMWRLQRVLRKPSTQSFGAAFGEPEFVDFAEAILRTVHWLRFMGYVGCERN